jgi:hypothetical protein
VLDCGPDGVVRLVAIIWRHVSCFAFAAVDTEDPEDPEVVDPEVYSDPREAHATEPARPGLSRMLSVDTPAGSEPAGFAGCFSFAISSEVLRNDVVTRVMRFVATSIYSSHFEYLC